MAIALAPAPPAGQAGGEPLALADGIELIGEYEGSGFKEPPLLVRRGDGQMIKLPRLLYLIAAAADGRRDPAAVAAVVTERYGKRVGAKSVGHLVEK
jgi:putative peptide zinc metalloprotease protein